MSQDSGSESSSAAASVTAKQFQEAGGTEDWRVLGLGVAAWFGTPDHATGAEFAARASVLPDGEGLEWSIRSAGVQVRLPLVPDDAGLTSAHVEPVRAVSAVAHQLGLAADPTVLQDVQLAIDTMDQASVLPFWEAALVYQPAGDEDLLDPLHRHPPIWFQDQEAPRPLRNRLHLDAVMAQEVATRMVETLRQRGASAVNDHGYYATVADAEGNEVDILPLPEGSDRWDGAGTEDWRLVFSAMACYPVTSAGQAAEFAGHVAALADEADLPLSIDLRPGLLVLDSGKDRPEMVDGYEQLAARVQQGARDRGLTADVSRPHFIQLGIDAVDIPAVREFWRVVLRYEEDPRPDVTDLIDPRQLNTVVFLQGLDAEDQARRDQRNRIHVDLFLPHDQVQSRLNAALAAGGTVVRDAAPVWWTVADPEGNEVDITTAVGREEHWAAQQGQE